MNRKWMYSWWRQCLLLLLIMVGLCGCAGSEQPAETVPEPVMVTVRFIADNQTVSEQTIEEGEKPAAVGPVLLPGLTFSGWLDNTGAVIDPAMVPVDADTEYTAILHPQLSNHVPYLFTDLSGSIRPEDALTADELGMALQMLAAEDARGYLSSMPSGRGEENAQTLRQVLTDYFTTDAISTAFSDVEEGTVTRGTFARIMNRLLGRNDETVTTMLDMVLPNDLHSGYENFFNVMEACVPHVRNTAGKSWEDTFFDMSWEPGYFNLDGYLYYADENGKIVRDTQVGTLTFGPDGRFTSGDAELDDVVAAFLAGFIRENPNADRLELLRRAYDHCRDEYTYLRREKLTFGQTDWEIEKAKQMFEAGHGNCYNYAAAFWALARGLGYEAVAHSGQVLGARSPHGWVTIEMDGIRYSFDPELEMSYRYERGYPNTDLYMKTAQQVAKWSYIYPKY